MQYKHLIIILIFFSNLISISGQEEWIVPEDNKSKLSPFEFTEETKAHGEEIFSANCKSCHGDPGKNNFVALVPPPGDPASDKFQTNTDGELYYKIRTGRVAMPSFSNTLTPDDVWSVISYIRSSNKAFVQEVAKEIQRGAYDGDVSILITFLEGKNLIEAKVVGTKNDVSEPIAGAGIKLEAERLFGNLQLDENKITNKDGIAFFAVKKDLPGDANGNINIIAQLTDQEAFGVVNSTALLPVGKETHAPSLVAKRAMWNKMKMAPFWILFGYSSLVLAAWGTIFFVLFQLKKIYALGKESD